MCAREIKRLQSREGGGREEGERGEGERGEGFNVTNLRSPFGSVNPACRSRIYISQPPSLVSLARFLHRNLWQFCNSSHWQKISGIGARTAGGDCECTRET